MRKTNVDSSFFLLRACPILYFCIRKAFGIYLGSIWDLFGIYLGSIWDLFGIYAFLISMVLMHSRPIWGNSALCITSSAEPWQGLTSSKGDVHANLLVAVSVLSVTLVALWQTVDGQINCKNKQFRVVSCDSRPIPELSASKLVGTVRLETNSEEQIGGSN